MNYLDLTLPNLAENLALDEALLLQAEAGTGGEVLRCWEWSKPAVILGAGCRLAEDVNEAACRADEIAIARRSSGGGTVLLGQGCLLFSLVLAYDHSPLLREIPSSYRFILDRMCVGLRSILNDVSQAGISDLAAAGLKFSGNAQQRKRHHLLHHGTLLYDFDLARVSRYLHPPLRQPEYRHERPHDAFLRNLPTSAAQLKQALQATWQASPRAADRPTALVAELTRKKYSQPEWTRRR